MTDFRDDPRWREAQAQYVAEGDDSDNTFVRRVKAALVMLEVETASERGEAA